MLALLVVEGDDFSQLNVNRSSAATVVVLVALGDEPSQLFMKGSMVVLEVVELMSASVFLPVVRELINDIIRA